MNRPSLGKGDAASLALGVALFAVMAGGAWADDGARSGRVEAKVSTLAVTLLEGTPRMEEYALPTEYSGPFGLAIGKGGIVWVTLTAGNALGRFDPASGEYREYRIPSTVDLPEVDWQYDDKERTTPEKTVTNYSSGNPGRVVLAPDGSVWMVALMGNSLIRFEPDTEEFTEYLFDTPHSQPYDLVAAPDGRIWFVLKNAQAFGYLDPVRQKMVTIPLGEGAQPMAIALDREGDVWVSDVAGNTLGRYQPATRSYRSYQINTPMAQPGVMRFDADGRLWFCQMRTKQIGAFIPDPGIFSVVDVPGYNASPQALATVGSSAIWMVDSMMNRIGRFDLVELTWRMFDIKTANAQPMDVAVDPAGDVWFTENDRHANKITRLFVASLPAASAPSGAAESAAGSHEHGAPAPDGALRAPSAPVSSPVEGYGLLGLVALIAIGVVGGWGWFRRSHRSG